MLDELQEGDKFYDYYYEEEDYDNYYEEGSLNYWLS